MKFIIELQMTSKDLHDIALEMRKKEIEGLPGSSAIVHEWYIEKDSVIVQFIMDQDRARKQGLRR